MYCKCPTFFLNFASLYIMNLWQTCLNLPLFSNILESKPSTKINIYILHIAYCISYGLWGKVCIILLPFKGSGKGGVHVRSGNKVVGQLEPGDGDGAGHVPVQHDRKQGIGLRAPHQRHLQLKEHLQIKANKLLSKAKYVKL